MNNQNQTSNRINTKMPNQTTPSTRTTNRRNPQTETNENEFESHNPINFPPPRTPLNSIPDPSQFHLPESRHGSAVSVRIGNLLSEPNSAQSTPARASSRGLIGGGSSRVSLGKGGILKGTEILSDVRHFELKDDPSFWTDHNVQVLIRIRPLSTMEKLSQGNGRCLKQESAHTMVWLGHPETRFTFDHIGCETLSQENLFRAAGVPMVENCLSGYNSCMFAYGQTGSGKTYTMMGEIKETQRCLAEDSGITPRVFDYLFTRIKAEEESRNDCKLKYTCKCSFLEIYNEQITDLLEPSSTNLQLREDMKKGVYVENLTEHSVVTVNDVLRLLVQGTANRKVAATHMNCESSRSHSVFTCIIESRWEKDSMTHFRFARLNLVDLAGSERQKSSGADSERLKEAVNINKSLSTLGLVIMTLVDLAHGKPRHVPYRDSRLTFLLQDSLGGNSKTMIIANVSPSICSANETLSTLKFAQRAKLIQNNAKVNEDASGDISALQWQIQQLKGQLSFLTKNTNFPPLVSNLEPNSDSCRMSEVSEENDSIGERVTEGHRLLTPNTEIKRMKAALVGSLMREKMAETTIQDLKVENDHRKCLVRKKEEDAHHTSNMLRNHKEKIKQLELLVDGQLSAEKYLMEENRALKEEIQLLKMKNDRNSESSSLALENERLLQQLQIFQNFYEHGERERLLTELSELRDQLLLHLQEKITFSTKNRNQDIDATHELEVCQNMNSKLLREVGNLQTELGKYLNYNQVKSNSAPRSSFDHPDELLTTDKFSQLETISLGSNSGDEMPSFIWEYKNNKELEAKLERMRKDLKEVRFLNDQYQEKWALQLSQKQQMERVCQEVEMETTKTIIHLQEEVASLQSELEGRLCSIDQENTELRNVVAAKEEEMRSLCLDWEKAILELTTFLLEGSRSLKDACGQVQNISSSFPKANTWVSEHVGRAVKKYIENEETIHQLQSSLEDARKMILEMELKVCSLKEATLTLSAFQHLDNEKGVEEASQLSVLLTEKTNMIKTLENEIKYKNDQLCKAAKQVDVAFLVAKWLSDCKDAAHMNNNNNAEDISIPNLDMHGRLSSCTTSENQDVGNSLILNDLMGQVELTKLEVLEMENAVKTRCVDTEMQTADLQGELHNLPNICSSIAESIPSTVNEGIGKIDHHRLLIQNVQEEPDLPNVFENMALKNELERKQELLEGLLFDFRLLQESASNSKEIKDQTETLICSLSQAQYELEIKSSEFDDILVQNRKLEASLADTENNLTRTNYELELAKKSIEKFLDQNEELRDLLKELYANKTELEEQLNEHKEVIKGLENEIANLTASLENQSLSLFESIENELNQVMMFRDQLREEVHVLNDKLEMAYSLVDEKEAIAMEARQESESSKVYAEQKEEEVKILEHSVEELESTINVLEKRVYEMDEEVERHRSISDSLKVELQAFKERLLLVENLSQNSNSERMSVQPGEKISRQLPSKVLELHEALIQIKLLEKENAEKDQEIKKCKEYISEIVLHAEAQTLQYQQKYKCLESMFREVKTDMSHSTSMVPTSEKMEKSSTRTRGSSSPFRCISNIVQQMNQEKDQELSAAKLRVEELESLAASRQKEVCMLQTRLAATESMTHDVIRDLLGIKLDITDYASLIDQNQIVKLVEEAHQQKEEFIAKEKENLNLRQHINNLIEERESCIMDLQTKETNMLASQIAVQQLQGQDQLLSAQNEMLKMDKTNLMRKIAEFDDMVKTLLGTHNSQQFPQSRKTKDKSTQKLGNDRFTERLSQSERLLARVNEELTQYCKTSGDNLHS